MILDTNALSAKADGDRSLEPVVDRAFILAIPAVVLGEFRFGVIQSRYRTKYEERIEEFQGHCTVLDVDRETAIHYAAVRLELKRKGSPIPVNDVWIAAAARQCSLPILSRDAHFDSVAGVLRMAW